MLICCLPIKPLPLGRQLTEIKSELDIFWRFRDALLRNDEYREEYDNLKRNFEGVDVDFFWVVSFVLCFETVRYCDIHFVTGSFSDFQIVVEYMHNKKTNFGRGKDERVIFISHRAKKGVIK